MNFNLNRIKDTLEECWALINEKERKSERQRRMLLEQRRSVGQHENSSDEDEPNIDEYSNEDISNDSEDHNERPVMNPLVTFFDHTYQL